MGDRFRIVLLIPAALVFGTFALMITVFASEAAPAFAREGLGIYLSNVWRAAENPAEEYYGVLAAIYGTLYTSLIAVSISLPLSTAFAIFVVDYAPGPLKEPLNILTDIMAGLPTIIYGLWGATTLVPLLKELVMEPLHRHLGFIPLFSYEPRTGYSILAAGVLLGIMVTPFSAAVVREAYRMVPRGLREAAYSIGATRYEATKILLGAIRPALVSGTLLAFGRAVGETVAVSLVVGNSFTLHLSPFAPGYTVSSLIANQFGNSFIYAHMTSALYAAGLGLVALGLAANLAGIALVRRYAAAG